MALDKYTEITNSRGERISGADLELFQDGDTHVSFMDNPRDVIVVRLYDRNSNLLGTQFRHKTPELDPSTQQIIVEPETDIRSFGYESGEYTVEYNFWKFEIGNNTRPGVHIKDVSASRTEARILPLGGNDKNEAEFINFANNVLTDAEATHLLDIIFDQLDPGLIHLSLPDEFRTKVANQYNLISAIQFVTTIEKVLEDTYDSMLTRLTTVGVRTQNQFKIMLNTELERHIVDFFENA